MKRRTFITAAGMAAAAVSVGTHGRADVTGDRTERGSGGARCWVSQYSATACGNT